MLDKKPNQIQHYLDLQRDFMHQLGITDFPVTTPAESQLVRDTIAQIMDEASETFRPTMANSKPWKPASSLDDRNIEIRAEAIDILFFLLELFNILGMDAEVISYMYTAKLLKNHERIAEAMSGRYEVKTIGQSVGALPQQPPVEINTGDKIYDVLKKLTFSAASVSVRRQASHAVAVYEGREEEDTAVQGKYRGDKDYLYRRAAKCYAIAMKSDQELLGVALGLFRGDAK